MKYFLFVLTILSSLLGVAQECVVIRPEVKTMGLSNRIEVNLDDVEVVTLPIVFHIMHTGQAIGEGANITDDQVVEVLAQANQMFRKVPGSVGDGDGVDTKIDFCLAQRDPEGNPTTGVTRHDLSSIPVYVEDGVSPSSLQPGMNDEAMKEIACWDVDKYVNVYIVTEIGGNNGGGGIQGYAYLGPTNDCRDGVVMLSNKMVVSPYNLGKTFVHELGHYLTIDHTFANTFSCTQETNCETQGDRICDTPPTTTNNFCSFPDCPDAITENYMDYTGETCRNMYTTGQAERMHECILEERDGLTNNLACVPPVDFDAGLSNLLYKPSFCLDNQDVSVDVVGFSINTVPVATVVLTANGVDYEQWVYDIEYGETYEVVFESAQVQGSFDIELLSDSDQYAGNNMLSGVVDYEPGSLFEMDFTSDFFASENSWQLVDLQSGDVVLEDGPWSAGIVTREYETCLYGGCYNLVITDQGGDGMPYGGNVDLWIDGEYYGVDVSGDWEALTYEVCVESFQNNCASDLDGDGVVGVEDIAILVNNYECMGDCEGDINGDQIVNVLDMLDFLVEFGRTDCIESPDLFVTSVTEIVPTPMQPTDSEASLEKPVYYDMSGRVVPGPLENLAPGVYISKCPKETKKIFVAW
jgi:hypothetical protein